MKDEKLLMERLERVEIFLKRTEKDLSETMKSIIRIEESTKSNHEALQKATKRPYQEILFHLGLGGFIMFVTLYFISFLND